MVTKALQNEPVLIKYYIVIIKMRKEEFTVTKPSDFNNDNQHAQLLDVLTHNRNNSHVKCIIQRK